MNTTLIQTEWESCLLEPGRDRALESLARRAYGTLPPDLPYLVHCPWVARATVQMNYTRELLVHVDFALADVVAMVVSQENSCRFCYAVSHWLLRVQGLSEARIAELQAQLAQGLAEPRTAAAVAFARRMSRSQPLVGSAERRRLRAAGFGAEEAREIAYVVAYLSFANRVTTIPAIPPYQMERLPDRWLFAVLRPLMARMVNSHRKRGERVPATERGEGFYSEVLRAYGDSPIARSLAQVLDELWASAVLSRRCKALLFAVVATGLGCSRSVEESCRVLRAEGLSDAAIGRALTHLQAPELDDVENLLLPFARDTIWYQPAAVQRRARELRARLSPAQFVEAVGVLALANALCRLAPAVLEPA